MIYDSIQNIENYKGIDERVYKALVHIKNNDFSKSSGGANIIDGDNLFYNFVEAQTNKYENSEFEAHKAYADIHVDIEGTEDIYVSDISVMQAKTEYSESDDFMLMSGEKQVKITLKPGYFAVCLPNDIHMPMVAPDNKPQKIKKAIYKVKLN